MTKCKKNILSILLTLAMLFVSLGGYISPAFAEEERPYSYTVEFTYNDLQYVMEGDTTVVLDEILAELDVSGGVTSVETSAPELFSAQFADGAWTVTAHQPFTSSEWMRVAAGGEEHLIAVTDAVYQETIKELYVNDGQYVFYCNGGSQQYHVETLYSKGDLDVGMGNYFYTFRPAILDIQGNGRLTVKGLSRFGMHGMYDSIRTFTLRLRPGNNAWIIRPANGRWYLEEWRINQPTYKAEGCKIKKDGSGHELITGSGSSGPRHYRFRKDGGAWSAWSSDVPKAAETGNYEIQWYSDFDDNWLPNGSESNPAETVNAKIVETSATAPVLTGWSGTYDGSAHSTQMTGAANGTVYYRSGINNIDWSDWSADVPTRTGAGITYVQAYTKGDDNHTDSKISNTARISIARAEPQADAPDGLSALCGQTLADININNPEGNTPGTWAWSDPETTSVGEAGEHTFKADFTPDDKTNYNSKSGVDVTVTVNKAGSPVTVNGSAEVVRGGKTVDLADNVSLNGAAGKVSYSIAGDVKGCTLEGSVLTSGNETGTVTVNVTVAEDGNYMALGATPIKVTIADKNNQTIAAGDVTAAWGDTDKKISARVTAPSEGSGTISYAVKAGSEDYLEVDAHSGALTIKKIPQDGRAFITITAAETETCRKAEKDVTVTISKADAVAAMVRANDRAGDGTAQPLVAVDGLDLLKGTMYYALGSNAAASPADSAYTESIPKAANAGTYYVWYKVKGDENHNDTAPACVTVNVTGGKDTGETSENQLYSITSEDDWNEFARMVNKGKTFEGITVRLTSDISVTEMVGTDACRFRGFFDGDGHTLTFTCKTGDQYAAPFRYVDGAKFCNLRVDGSITTSNKFAAGFVGYSRGNTTFTSCRSSIKINSSVNGDGTHGGFAALIDEKIAFINCLFDGSISGTSTDLCGGFAGWPGANTVLVKNSLNAGTFDTKKENNTFKGCGTFSRTLNAGSIMVKNSYYFTAYGEEQGSQTDARGEALKNMLGAGWEVSESTAAGVIPVISDRAAELGISEYETVRFSGMDWIVLDPLCTNGYLSGDAMDAGGQTASGLLLLAKDAQGQTTYTDSKDWCADFYKNKINSNSRTAVLGIKTDDYLVDGTGSGSSDKVFFLSAAEYEEYNGSGSSGRFIPNAGNWWLRTEKVYTDGNGKLHNDGNAGNSYNARPALNLKPDQIISFTNPEYKAGGSQPKRIIKSFEEAVADAREELRAAIDSAEATRDYVGKGYTSESRQAVTDAVTAGQNCLAKDYELTTIAKTREAMSEIAEMKAAIETAVSGLTTDTLTLNVSGKKYTIQAGDEIYASGTDMSKASSAGKAYAGYPMFRVLKVEDGRMLLMSEYLWAGGKGSNLYGKVPFGSNGNSWQGSIAQEWADAFGNDILGQITGLEIGSLSENVNDSAYTPASGQASGEFSFAESEGILTAGEKVFLLSGEETMEFMKDKSGRIAKLYDGDEVGDASYWWLRSPIQGNARAGQINADGSAGTRATSQRGYMRPVFWAAVKEDIDPSAISRSLENVDGTGRIVYTIISHIHTFGDPEWIWAVNNASASARFTCTDCGHTETVTAAVTSETGEKKTDGQGQIYTETTYTAKAAFDNKEYTDTKTVKNVLDAAKVQTAPEADTLTYSGQEQKLVAEGTAAGGTMSYALGNDDNTAPADDSWSAAIPAGTDAGTYYVWYKAAGDANHKDSDPACVKVTVNRAEAEPPVIMPKPYTGSVQTADIKDTDIYKVTQNNGGTAEGSYNVVLTLKDPANYKWSSSDEAAITLKFDIVKIVLPVAAPVTYDPDQTLKDVPLMVSDTLAESSEWDWKWVNQSIRPTVGNNGYEVVLEGVDDQTYNLDGVEGYDAEKHTITQTIPLTVNKAEVSAPAIEDREYSGKNQTADIAESGLYTVTKNEGGTNAGTYDVELTLKDPDNYMWNDSEKAAKTLSFNITKSADFTVTTPTMEAVTYDPAKQLSNISLPEGWRWTAPDIVPTVANAGYTACITVDDANYDCTGVEGYVAETHQVTRTIQLTVNKAEAEIPAISSETYTGAKQKANIEDTDIYTVTQNAGGISVGSFDVELTLKDPANYKWEDDSEAASKTLKFKITRAEAPSVTTTTPTVEAVTYDPAKKLLDIALEEGWSWLTPDAVPTVTNAGYEAVITVDDANYDYDNVDGWNEETHQVTRNVKVTVNKAESTAAVITANNRIYDGSSYPLITVDDSILAGGEMQYALGTDGSADEPEHGWSASIPEAANAGTYEVWFKVIGDENHKDSETACVEVTVNKAEVEPPVIMPKPYTGSIQTADIEETDLYSVTENNGGTEVGEYDVVLTLKDSVNYKWTDSKEASITLKFGIADIVLPVAAPVTYNPGQTLKDIPLMVEESLAESTEWNWKWKEPDTVPVVGNAGYEAVLEGVYDDKYNLEGVEGYDPVSHSITRTIALKVSKAAVTAPAIADKIYNGRNQTADIAVSSLYKVTKNDGGTEVGSYDVVLTLTDAGNYSWADSEDASINLIFDIRSAVASDITTPTVDAVTYDPERMLSDIVLPEGWNWTAPDTVPEVANTGYAAGISVDDTNYDYTGVEGYDAATHQVTRNVAVTVNRAEVELPIIMPKPYTGLKQTADIAETEFYTVSKNDGGTDLGTYDVVLTLKDATNYMWSDGSGEASVTLKFEIAEIVLPVAAPVTYNPDLTLKDVPLMVTGSLAQDTEWDWKWADPSIKPAVGSNEYEVVLEGVYDDKYNLDGVEGYDPETHSITRKITLNVNKAAVAAPAIADKVYNGKNQTADVAESDLYTVIQNDGGTNAGTYAVELTLKNTGNYKWKDGSEEAAKTLSFRITKAEAPLVTTTTPTVDAVTYDPAKKLSDIILKDGWNWTAPNTVPKVKNNGYAACITVDDANYDYTGVEGYNVKTHQVTRTIPLTVNKAEAESPDISSKPYTGSRQKADIAASSLYTVTKNSGGTSVGRYDVVLTLKDTDNYKWKGGSEAASKTLRFEITKAEAPAVTATTPVVDAVTYDPAKKLSDITLTDGWSWTEPDTVPTVTNAGYEAGITVDDVNYDYTGVEGYNAETHKVTRTVKVTVNKAEAEVPVIMPKPYTGSTQTADIAETAVYTVTKNDGGIELGKYDVVLTLKDPDNYKWSDGSDKAAITLNFEIAEIVLPVTKPVTYNPAQTLQDVPLMVTDSLAESTEWDWKWKEPYTVPVVDNKGYEVVLEGVYDDKYNLDGVEGYDSDSHTITRTIPLTVNKAAVNIPAVADKVYNGKKQTADIEDTGLYTVTQNSGGTSAGSYDVVLTLKDAGNYKWNDGSEEETNTLSFRITKAEAPIVTTTTPTVDELTYDPDKKLSDITLEGGWSWTAPGIVPTVTNAGYEAGITVDDANYDYTGVDGYDSRTHKVTRTVAVTVNKAEVEIPVIMPKPYTGSTQTADIEPTDLYTVTQNDGGTELGTYDVVLTLKDAANYKWSDGREEAAITLKFDIAGIILPVTNPVTYDPEKTLNDIPLVVEKSLANDWKWQWADPYITPEVGNAGYKAVLEIEDADKYNLDGLEGYDPETHLITRTIAVKVNKAAVTAPVIADKVYNGKNQTADIAASDLYTVTQNEGGTNAGRYAVEVTLADAKNYKWKDGSEEAAKTLSFRITKAEAPSIATTTPTVEAVTYDPEKSLADITLPNNWSWADPDIVPTVKNSGYAACMTVDDVNYDCSDVEGYNAKTHQVTRIIKLVVNKAEAEIPAISSKPYTGSRQKADISDTGIYTVTQNKGGIAVGSYGVVLTLKDADNYKWKDGIEAASKRLSFEITIAEAPAVTTTTPVVDAVTYDPAKKLSDITLTEGWSWMEPDTVPTVTNAGYEAGIKVDDVNYDYTGVEGYNAETHKVTRTVALTVNKAIVEIPVIMPKPYIDSTQTADIADNDIYTVTENAGGTEIGTYDVVLTLKDYDNYKWAGDSEAADITLKFEIADILLPAAAPVTYAPDQTLADIPLVQADGWDWKWKEPATVPVVDNQGYAVVLENVDDQNYNLTNVEGYDKATRTITRTIALTVNRAEVNVPVIESRVYNGEPQTAVVEASDLYTVTKNDGGTNAGSYEVGLTLTDTDNYKWSDGSVEAAKILAFEITKAAAPAVAAPTLDSVSYDPEQTLADIKLPEGWSWIDGTIVPDADTKEYSAMLTVDDANYDYTGVEGYDASTHSIIRQLSLTVIVDKTDLNAAIAEALSYYDSIKDSESYQDIAAELKDAIDAASAAAADENAAKAAVDDAASAIRNAKEKAELVRGAKDVIAVEMITADNKESIKEYLESYDKLSDAEQEIIGKAIGKEGRTKLSDLEKALAVTDRISDLKDKDNIAAGDEKTTTLARSAYDLLSESQKALISEDTVKKLETAEAAIEELKAQDEEAKAAEAKAKADAEAAAKAKTDQLATAKALAEARLEEYSAVKAKSDATAAEKKAYDAAVAKGKAAINAAADKKAVASALKEAKKTVNAALKKIDKDRAEAAKKAVTTVTVNAKTVSVKSVKAAIKKAGGDLKYVKKIVLGKKVKKISKGAFKKCRKVKTLVIKTKKLKKSAVKKSLKGSKIKKIKVKAGKKKINRKYVKKYRKIFTKKIAGRKVKVSL